MKYVRFHSSVGLLALSVFVTACSHKEEIQVYRLAKGQEDAKPAAPPDMPGMPAMSRTEAAHGLPDVPAGPASAVVGITPKGWESRPLSTMRQASFQVKGEKDAVADVSLVVLGGAAGGVLDNVNRWLTQLGQPSITEEALQKTARHIKSSLGDVTVVDLQGLPEGADAAKDGRILAGLATAGDRTFFFKMRGNAALVESQKTNFINWVSSVKTVEAPSAKAPVEAAPASAPATAPAAVESGKPKVRWNVPASWKEVPAASMRYASFSVAGAKGDTADVSVIVLPGQAGGDLENVNRWRGQIGLAPVDDAALKALLLPVKAKDGDIQLADMTGPKARVLAAWTRNEGSTWFFKMNGPDALVAAEKEKFIKFLQSVQLHP